MNRLEEIAENLRSDAGGIETYINNIDRLSDDEDKDYVLLQLELVKTKLQSLATIIELMDEI